MSREPGGTSESLHSSHFCRLTKATGADWRSALTKSLGTQHSPFLIWALWYCSFDNNWDETCRIIASDSEVQSNWGLSVCFADGASLSLSAEHQSQWKVKWQPWHLVLRTTDCVPHGPMQGTLLWLFNWHLLPVLPSDPPTWHVLHFSLLCYHSA